MSSRWKENQKIHGDLCSFHRSSQFSTNFHTPLWAHLHESCYKEALLWDNKVWDLSGRDNWGWSRQDLASTHLNLTLFTSVWHEEPIFLWKRGQTITYVKLILYFFYSGVVFWRTIRGYAKRYGQYVRVSKMNGERWVHIDVSVGVISRILEKVEIILD